MNTAATILFLCALCVFILWAAGLVMRWWDEWNVRLDNSIRDGLAEIDADQEEVL